MFPGSPENRSLTGARPEPWGMPRRPPRSVPGRSICQNATQGGKDGAATVSVAARCPPATRPISAGRARGGSWVETGWAGARALPLHQTKPKPVTPREQSDSGRVRRPGVLELPRGDLKILLELQAFREQTLSWIWSVHLLLKGILDLFEVLVLSRNRSRRS